MKITDLALLAASAAVVYVVLQGRSSGGTGTWTPWKQVAAWDGWQYFNDGSQGLAIDPMGDYYLNGELVWSAPRVARS